MKLSKRLLAILLVLAMMLVCMPVSIFAEEVTEEPEEVTYIELRTIEDLYNVRNDLTANYILMNDIDMTEATALDGDWDYGGRGWNPIGSNDIYSNSAFSGIFDGNSHKIIGMRIHTDTMPSGSDTSYAGLFTYVTGTVRNLTMENVNISDGCDYTGAIAGYVGTNGVISNCSVSGSIAKGSHTGGIAGENCGTISGCFNLASVTGTKNVGGIVGRNIKRILNCYNTGHINCSVSNSNWYVGGIAGIQDGTSTSAPATIQNCYSVGSVSAAYSGHAYAVAYNNSSYGRISNGYYRTGSSAQSTGATALTEAQMKLQTTYSGFDFGSVWFIDAEAVYPYPQLKTNPQETRVIQTAKIATLPEKVVYLLDDALNMTGCTLEFTFANAETEYVTVTSDMVTGYNSRILGEQTLTINCYGKTFTFTVTVEEPVFVEIRTILDLYNIRNNLSGNYILMNDIDLTEATAKGGSWDYGGRGWNPIGSGDNYSGGDFSGIFDGNGYAIKGLRIYLTDSNEPAGMSQNAYSGLFAKVSGTVRNLRLVDVNIENSYYYSNNYYTYVGAIAARTTATATITGCGVSGKVTGYRYANVGGVVGYNCGKVTNCFNTATIQYTDTSSSYNTYAGGIAGYNTGNAAVISDCYNAGDVYGGAYSGGIVGYHYSGSVVNCYNIGTIKTSENSTTLRCGIAHLYNGTITNSYYLSGAGVSSTGATALTEAQMQMQDVFAGFDFETVWTINNNANYPYPQLQSNIQDMSEAVELVRVIAYPAKLDYLTGDELMLVGGLVEVVYVSGNTEILAITEDIISGYDPALVGTQTLSVTIGDKSDTFEINVARRPVAVSVALASEPTKKQFVIGTAFDFTGAKIQVTYDDDTSKVLDVTEDMTTGGNINHLGTQTITVTVDEQSVTFTVKVVPASLANIAVANLPKKVAYRKGEQLDTTGLEIVGVYTSGTQVKIASGYTVSGYNSETIGTQTVTVDFAGKTATFEVTVNKWPLSALKIQTNPDKLNYVVGDVMDLTGLVVVATYANGDVEITEDYTVSGFDTVTAGTKTVKIEKDGCKDAFTILVSDPEVGENDPKIVMSSKKVNRNCEFTVAVEIKNNPGFCYLELTPYISPELTLVKVENGQMFSDFTKDNQYIWIAEEDVTADGLLVTFTLLADESVAAGSYKVGFGVRTCANYQEQLQQLAVVNADIEVVDYIFGDANNDNVVDGLDVIRLKKYLASYNYETGVSDIEISDAADANGDGVIDGLDVIRLKKYLASYNYETGESTVPLGPQ